MFTGLVECTGRIESIRRSPEGSTLAISSPLETAQLTLGESVAVNGACLTVATIDSASTWTANASLETLARTNLGDLSSGSRVNLERALRVGDRLGGHLVLGHVDGRGRTVRKETRGNSTWLEIEAPESLLPLIVEKGSIAVDGISLTVNELTEHGFALTIVPFTADEVVLLDRPRDWRPNLETDILGKHVARLLAFGRVGRDAVSEWLGERSPDSSARGLTLDALRAAGFDTKR